VRLAGTARIGRWLARARHITARDRGSSAVELAILAPALLIFSLLIIQFALWFDARHAALAAAQEGARVAREEERINVAWQADAQNAATRYFAGLDTSVLNNVQVPAPILDQATNTVSVTVTGKMNGIFPLPISATAGGPVECFRPAGGAGQC